MNEKWFSAKLRFACLVEHHGLYSYQDSVYVFRAKWFDDAFDKALYLGRKQEREYRNADGETVVWRLKEILSLDLIQGESLEGAEVYSEPITPPEVDGIPFDAELHPELSEPTQTV